MDVNDYYLCESSKLNKSTDSPMEVSSLNQLEMGIDEKKLDESCLNNSNHECDLSRNSESDLENSICFNKSILVMLQCEENEKNVDLLKHKDQNYNLIEPIHDDSTIEEISVDVVQEIVKNNLFMNSIEYSIIDVRFPYEFKGGHIKGALNLYTPIQILKHFFIPSSTVDTIERDIENDMDTIVDQIMTLKPFRSKLSIIFHCEFSSVRGPKMAEEFRSMDRFANLRSYPNLYFPNVFIMKNGYKEFYSRYKEKSNSLECIFIYFAVKTIRDLSLKLSSHQFYQSIDFFKKSIISFSCVSAFRKSFCEPRNYLRMDPDELSDISVDYYNLNLKLDRKEYNLFLKSQKINKKEQTKQMNHHIKCVEKQIVILSDIKKRILMGRKN